MADAGVKRRKWVSFITSWMAKVAAKFDRRGQTGGKETQKKRGGCVLVGVEVGWGGVCVRGCGINSWSDLHAPLKAMA